MDGENIKRIIFINDSEDQRTIKIQYKKKPLVADTTFNWFSDIGGSAIVNLDSQTITGSTQLHT